MSWPDDLIVVIYLVGIAALGSSFYRRRTTPKEYFLASKGFGWLPAGISIIAADTSAITVMGGVAWSFSHNLEVVWLAIGYLLMAPLVNRIFIPFYISLNLYTAYEYLERRFNLSVRLLMSAFFQFLRSVHVALAIYAPSLIIKLVTDRPLWECILVMGLISTLYTTLGGMKAVIWTDVIQFCTMCSGITTVFLVAMSRINGGTTEAFRMALHGGHLQLFNFSFNPHVLTSFWACLLGGCILNLAPLTTDQAVLQRIFTTKSRRDAERSVWLNALIAFPMSLGLLLLGVILWVFYEQRPVSLIGFTDSDTILPFFVVRELRHGIAGLLIAALFAASMGVMSSGINALSTATTVDFYMRVFRPNQTDKHYVTIGRIFTACWGVAGTVIALFGGHLGQLAIAYARVGSLVVGPMIGVFLLGMLSRRTTSAGVFVGASLGIAAVALVSLGTNWSFFYLGPIGTAAAIAAGLISSLFMTKPRQQQLDGLVLERPLRFEFINIASTSKKT